MTDTQFICASLFTAYVLGWALGATFLYFKQLLEISTS